MQNPDRAILITAILYCVTLAVVLILMWPK
jgi:hypothetical protein